MLIQETHKDVSTKADGKEGSMSISPRTVRDEQRLIIARDFPLPSIHSQLSQCVCSTSNWCKGDKTTEASPDDFLVFVCSARYIKVGRVRWFLWRQCERRKFSRRDSAWVSLLLLSNEDLLCCFFQVSLCQLKPGSLHLSSMKR